MIMSEKTRKLALEYEKAFEKMETAFAIWTQHDEVDPFAKTTRKAFRDYSRAADRKDKAFDAYMKACQEDRK